MKPFVTLIFAALVLCSCASQADKQLKTALQSSDPRIKMVMQNPNYYELQLIYTQIQRDKNGKVHFKDASYHLDANQFFYSASTVKMPVAALVLEKLDSLHAFSPSTTFTVGSDTTHYNVARQVQKIFAVSDNEAYNQFYEFLGRDAINKKLEAKGIKPVQVRHRFSYYNSPQTQAVTVFDNGKTIRLNPLTESDLQPYQLKNTKKGIAYHDKNDSLVKQAFDFTYKNYLPLNSLHEILKRLQFPENFKPSEQFHFTPETHKFLATTMGTIPRKEGYDPVEYYDGYAKYFMFGDTKERMPENLKIYNKVGMAYGTLTDCAYIVDQKNKVEFLISATLLVNKDQIFNDDQYDYDSIGLPFLAQLGRELYQLHLEKK